MSIKRRKDNSLPERQIITGLIVSDDFIKAIYPILDLSLFQSRFTKIVGEWSIEYYELYATSPKGVIQEIYNSRKVDLDETISEAIELFLSSISDEFDRDEKFNYRYVLDQAEKYLQLRKLKTLADNINSNLSGNELLEAELIVSNFNQIRLPENNGLDLFRDLDRVKEILSNKDKAVIFKFPGKLGEIMNDNCRGELLAFSGPEKRGKSWWLQEIGMIAILNGFNVAHFSLEMLEEQMVIRQLQYLTGKPAFKRDIGCKIPYLNNSGNVRTKKSEKELLQPFKAVRKLKALWPMVRGSRFKLICWPPSTKSLTDIEAQLNIWENQENFIPDLIIVDHADRCLPRNSKQDKRHQIDSIWEDLKALSMKRFCLVATATHTTKEAHTKNITKGSSTAEDKRKAGHVDRMIGLNQDEQDEKNNIMRLNTIFERNAAEKGNIQVSVLHQFAIGKPYLDSFIDKNK